MENVPISKNIIQPIIKSNILYVDSLEAFEKLELEYNQTVLAFDNFYQRFYTKGRNNFGEYSPVKIYFYDDFATKMQNETNQEFYDKCKALKFDTLKTELAYKFFIQNEKTMSVWLWLLETKKSDMEYDSLKHLKCELKKKFLSLNSKK